MNQIKLGRQNIVEKEILNEKNDCTVRALMEGLGVPYMTAYGMAIGCGRRKNKGCFLDSLLDNIAKPHPRPKMSVVNYIQYIAHSGNWIIQIRGHVFAVIDGVLKDEYPKANLDCHVIKAWRVK